MPITSFTPSEIITLVYQAFNVTANDIAKNYRRRGYIQGIAVMLILETNACTIQEVRQHVDLPDGLPAMESRKRGKTAEECDPTARAKVFALRNKINKGK